MRIYNYLFYKSYLASKWSKNFEGTPVLGGIWGMILCVMLNIFTIVGFIEGLGVDTGIEFKKEYKIPFGIGLVALLYFYYAYKGRYKKIIEYYEKKEEEGMIKIHPAIVIIVYYVTSVFLMFLAAFFKNKDWIFAP